VAEELQELLANNDVRTGGASLSEKGARGRFFPNPTFGTNLKKMTKARRPCSIF